MLQELKCGREPVPLMSTEGIRLQATKYLNELFDEAKGDQLNFAKPKEIGARVGLDGDQTLAAVEYLDDAGLLKLKSWNSVHLTFFGIKEIQKSRARPDEPTEYLAAYKLIAAGPST